MVYFVLDFEQVNFTLIYWEMVLGFYLSVGFLLQQVTESDVVDVVESVLKDSRITSTTVAFALTTLLKLSSRFPDCAE